MLLGILLALLPLRGWAEAAMHLTAPAPQSAATEAGVPPCHAAMAESDGALPEEPAGGCPLCPLCSLCHGAALCACESRVEQAAVATTAHAAEPQGHGPPSLPLPERPPRA